MQGAGLGRGGCGVATGAEGDARMVGVRYSESRVRVGLSVRVCAGCVAAPAVGVQVGGWRAGSGEQKRRGASKR